MTTEDEDSTESNDEASTVVPTDQSNQNHTRVETIQLMDEANQLPRDGVVVDPGYDYYSTT